MRVLVIDVGGTHVKMLVTGQRERSRFDSGPSPKPSALVKQLTQGWSYDAISLGYPGLVVHGWIAGEPANSPPWRSSATTVEVEHGQVVCVHIGPVAPEVWARFA